jgi:Coenzyme PQQ synthesis protein D (PqqD)
MTVTIRHAPEIFSDTVDGAVVVCHGGSGRMCSLNSTAAFIWRHCDDRSPDELINLVSAAFPNQPRDEVAADTRQFVATLTDKGLLLLENC